MKAVETVLQECDEILFADAKKNINRNVDKFLHNGINADVVRSYYERLYTGMFGQEKAREILSLAF